jgi:uncharacterized protein YukE
MEVVNLLQFIGISWPVINEDTVLEVATVVQEFADNIEATHADTTATMQRMGEDYQGASYELLMQRWADMSGSHMTELLDACRAVVAALHAAAEYIVAMKAAAIAELVALAASFVADQAAAVATFGLAEAAEALIVEAAEKAVDFLKQQLIQYLIAEVIEGAFKALGPVIERAMEGFVFKAASAALGVDAGAPGGAGGGPAGGTGFRIHPENLRGHAQVLHGHAETMSAHADKLVTHLSGVSFT